MFNDEKNMKIAKDVELCRGYFLYNNEVKCYIMVVRKIGIMMEQYL